MNKTRPITLFTGQWADLPLEKLAEKTQTWGYDGLELACDGGHFEIDRALWLLIQPLAGNYL
jgi:sugar phosphate isomerase/epimerase